MTSAVESHFVRAKNCLQLLQQIPQCMIQKTVRISFQLVVFLFHHGWIAPIDHQAEHWYSGPNKTDDIVKATI